MKQLVKKVLEAGLVSKHTAQMFEQWGTLQPGDPELVGKMLVTEKTLEAFADDVEALLATEAESVRETRLDITVKSEVVFMTADGATAQAYVDELGRFVMPITQNMPGLRRGVTLKVDDATYLLLDIEPLYQNEKMVALQLVVDGPV